MKYCSSCAHEVVRKIPEGEGLGEAGGSPPSHSMLSDCFPEEQRGTALSIYTTGIYLGIFFGYFAGGWIADT